MVNSTRQFSKLILPKEARLNLNRTWIWEQEKRQIVEARRTNWVRIAAVIQLNLDDNYLHWRENIFKIGWCDVTARYQVNHHRKNISPNWPGLPQNLDSGWLSTDSWNFFLRQFAFLPVDIGPPQRRLHIWSLWICSVSMHLTLKTFSICAIENCIEGLGKLGKWPLLAPERLRCMSAHLLFPSCIKMFALSLCCFPNQWKPSSDMLENKIEYHHTNTHLQKITALLPR